MLQQMIFHEFTFFLKLPSLVSFKNVHSAVLKSLLDLIKPYNEQSSELQEWINKWKTIISLTCLTSENQRSEFVAKLTGLALNWYQQLSQRQPLRLRQIQGDL
jgi:hypothetical protein